MYILIYLNYINRSYIIYLTNNNLRVSLKIISQIIYHKY